MKRFFIKKEYLNLEKKKRIMLQRKSQYYSIYQAKAWSITDCELQREANNPKSIIN